MGREQPRRHHLTDRPGDERGRGDGRRRRGASRCRRRPRPRLGQRPGERRALAVRRQPGAEASSGRCCPTIPGGMDPALNADYPAGRCYLRLPLQLSGPAVPRRRDLQPEVAAGPPEISDFGRRYVFELRDDFRFSPPSNETVTAEAFARAIERALDREIGLLCPPPRRRHRRGERVPRREGARGRRRDRGRPDPDDRARGAIADPGRAALDPVVLRRAAGYPDRPRRASTSCHWPAPTTSPRTSPARASC